MAVQNIGDSGVQDIKGKNQYELEIDRDTRSNQSYQKRALEIEEPLIPVETVALRTGPRKPGRLTFDRGDVLKVAVTENSSYKRNGECGGEKKRTRRRSR